MFYIASATIFFLILTYLFHKKKFENICHCQRFYNILNNRELKGFLSLFPEQIIGYKRQKHTICRLYPIK